MARTLRQVLLDRLDTYERAPGLAEQDIRRSVASVDHMSSVFIVSDDLFCVCERYWLLESLVMALRDLARCATDDPANPRHDGL